MKQTLILVCVVLLAMVGVQAGKNLHVQERWTQKQKDDLFKQLKDRGVELPVEHNATVKIDHYNNEVAGTVNSTSTFKLRYLVNDQYYNSTQGPIIFYTGNEGDIYGFYNSAGFMTDTLAKKLGALVVFCEHRWYGTSYPFGGEVEAKQPENLKYLTVPQVLWDFIDVIGIIKADTTSYKNITNKAVIVGGGSYGGMLSAWMRMKYPNQVQGALAASAPILWFNGTINPNTWTNIAADVVKNKGSQNCYDTLKYGFYDMTNLVYDKYKWATLKDTFNMCEAPTSPDQVSTFVSAVVDGISGMVQVNYPYDVGTLPGNPVSVFCAEIDAITKAAAEQEVDATTVSMFNWTNINALAAAVDVNWQNLANKGDAEYCVHWNGTQGDQSKSTGLPFSWDIQTCLDLPLPLGEDPATSCWTWTNWDQAGWTSNCQKNFNLDPEYDWALDYFGGRMAAADFEYSSNIIFSNGNIDPWSGGGIMSNITTNNIALVIEDGAHHLDLRLPQDESDPYSVKIARQTEYAYIKKWAEDFQGQTIYDTSA